MSCSCTARFVSDLVGNLEDRLCCGTAKMLTVSVVQRCYLFNRHIINEGIQRQARHKLSTTSMGTDLKHIMDPPKSTHNVTTIEK